MENFRNPSSHRTRLQRLILNAGVVVVSVILALACLEIALRFTSYRHLLTRDRHLRYYYRFDPVKGYDIKPNVKPVPKSVDNRVEYRIWSNQLGCFDTPYHGEDQFILLVGDSFTHSFAPFEDKWGTRIEKLLHYRVLKCGVTGYGTYQELEKAKEIIQKVKKKPRLIIVGYFWNDLADDYFANLTVVEGFLVPAGKYRNPITHKLDVARLTKKYTLWEKLFSGTYPLSVGEMIRYYLDQHLIIINLINDTLASIFPGRQTYTHPGEFLAFEPESKYRRIWQHHFKNIAAFKDLAAANQAHLLFVLIPTNTQVYPFLGGHQGDDLEGPDRIMARFLTAQGIDFIDLLPLMRTYADETPRRVLNPDKDLYWRHNSHWSIQGEHLAGLLVSRYILEHRLVKVPDREARLKDIEAKLKDWRR